MNIINTPMPLPPFGGTRNSSSFPPLFWNLDLYFCFHEMSGYKSSPQFPYQTFPFVALLAAPKAILVTYWVSLKLPQMLTWCFSVTPHGHYQKTGPDRDEWVEEPLDEKYIASVHLRHQLIFEIQVRCTKGTTNDGSEGGEGNTTVPTKIAH
jgi:hypothetical protein